MTNEIKVGDWVRVIGVPPDVVDQKGVNTRSVLEKCLGRFFRVEAIERIEGLAYPLIQLNVGRVLGYENYRDSIWIEPEYLERTKASPASREADPQQEDRCRS